MRQLWIAAFHIIILLHVDVFAEVLIPRTKPMIIVPELKPTIIMPPEKLLKDRCIASSENIDSEIRLEFDNSKVQVSAFMRNGWYWFVISEMSISDLGQSLSGKLYQQYEVIRNDQYLAFRVKSNQQYLPLITQYDNILTIQFLDFSHHQQATKIMPSSRESHVSLILFSNINDHIEIIDPDFGDKLIVVLSDLDQKIVDREHHLPHFNLLRSYYGAAITARADNIRTVIERGVLHIYHPQVHWQKISTIIDIGNPIFQFHNWYNENSNFNDAMARVQRRIFEDDSLESRLQLVKLLLGHKMVPEALSYLNHIKEISHDYYENIAFKLLYFATLYLSHNYSEAYFEIEKLPVNDLSSIQRKEIRFWRDAIMIQLTNKLMPLSIDDAFLQQYLDYETDFMLLAFQQAVEMADYDKIRVIEKKLYSKKLSHFQHNQFMLLLADVMTQLQEYNEAMAIYDNIIADNKDIYHRALATVNKTKYLYENSIINTAQSIQSLEKLKILIKGEKVEPELLEMLATLYIDNQQYADSLFLLQEIHERFSHYDGVMQVHKKIHQVLVHLFNDGIIYEMSPLLVIDIFINFKEFLPVGKDGLTVSLNFTDYLISINLMSEAISFLKHLIQYRLKGQIRDDNVIKLANLYLDDNQPEQAIFLLNKYKVNAKAATYAQSHAFLKLKKYHLVHGLLEGDNSESADRIRCEILWQTNDWKRLITHLATRIEYYAQSSQELTEDEQRQIFYLAVAYFQQRDKKNLKTLRSNFVDRMLEKKNTIILLEKMADGHMNVSNFNRLFVSDL